MLVIWALNLSILSAYIYFLNYFFVDKLGVFSDELWAEGDSIIISCF